jgi:hypothetical protein
MLVPILMADIIESGKKDSKQLMGSFKQTISAVNNNDKLISPLTITLGDEFQGIVETVYDAIKIIFQIEEYILQNQFEFKLKYVLNFGKIETDINTKIAYEMLGEGLTTARERLNKLKKEDERFLILLGAEQSQLETILNKLFVIYQHLVDSWKSKDYLIVSEFIKKVDYKSVAKIVGIDESNAWRRRRSLNIKEYEAIKDVILTLLQHNK